VSGLRMLPGRTGAADEQGSCLSRLSVQGMQDLQGTERPQHHLALSYMQQASVSLTEEFYCKV
jgi:hypothetical protein